MTDEEATAAVLDRDDVKKAISRSGRVQVMPPRSAPK